MRSLPAKFLIPLVLLAAALLVLAGAGLALAFRGSSSSTSQQVAATGTSAKTGTGKGYLGLTVTVVRSEGLRVASVEDNGPAAKAGIRVGDVIWAVDGKVMRTPEQLRTAIEARSPGTDVTVTYARGDNEAQAKVKLGEEPANAAIEPSPTPAPGGIPGRGLGPARARLGVQIAAITPTLKQQYSLTRDTGVVVTGVEVNSPAAIAGLKPGDIIEAIDNVNVATVQDVISAVQGASGPTISVKYLRGSQESTVQATIGQGTGILGGLGNIPPQARQRLQQLLQDQLTPEQRQQLQNALQNNNIRVGTVKQVSDTSLTYSPLTGGSDVTIALTPSTAFRRGSQVIKATDLAPGETVIVISMDGGQTAFGVISLGQQAPFPTPVPSPTPASSPTPAPTP